MSETILILVVLAFSFYIGAIYNRVVVRKNETEKALGTLEVLLKKRYDLLPNLVEIAKQYALFEVNILQEILHQNEELDTRLPQDLKVQIHNHLNTSMSTLFLKSQNLPELKTSDHFLKLQAAWNESEEQISAARRYFNSTVERYNNAKQTFPANMFINPTRFPEIKYLEFEPESQNNIAASHFFNGSHPS